MIWFWYRSHHWYHQVARKQRNAYVHFLWNVLTDHFFTISLPNDVPLYLQGKEISLRGQFQLQLPPKQSLRFVKAAKCNLTKCSARLVQDFKNCVIPTRVMQIETAWGPCHQQQSCPNSKQETPNTLRVAEPKPWRPEKSKSAPHSKAPLSVFWSCFLNVKLYKVNIKCQRLISYHIIIYMTDYTRPYYPKCIYCSVYEICMLEISTTGHNTHLFPLNRWMAKCVFCSVLGFNPPKPNPPSHVDYSMWTVFRSS